MSPDAGTCITPLERLVDVLVVLVCLAFAIGFALRARRHFIAGRRFAACSMVVSAVIGGAVAQLWLICAVVGIPPFFMAATGVCEGARQPAEKVVEVPRSV